MEKHSCFQLQRVPTYAISTNVDPIFKLHMFFQVQIYIMWGPPVYANNSYMFFFAKCMRKFALVEQITIVPHNNANWVQHIAKKNHLLNNTTKFTLGYHADSQTTNLNKLLKQNVIGIPTCISMSQCRIDLLTNKLTNKQSSSAMWKLIFLIGLFYGRLHIAYSYYYGEKYKYIVTTT